MHKSKSYYIQSQRGCIHVGSTGQEKGGDGAIPVGKMEMKNKMKSKCIPYAYDEPIVFIICKNVGISR